MKFIDERGKLFGKVNIIDFFVILFLLSFIPMIYFGYKVILAQDMIKEDNQIMVKVRFPEIIPELITVIENNDYESGPAGNKIGYVYEILSVEPAKLLALTDVITDETLKSLDDILDREDFETNRADILRLTKYLTEDKSIRLIDHPTRKDIVMELYLKYSDRKGSMYYKNSPIKIGNPIIFSTDLYTISGIIIDMKEINAE